MAIQLSHSHPHEKGCSYSYKILKDRPPPPSLRAAFPWVEAQTLSATFDVIVKGGRLARPPFESDLRVRLTSPNCKAAFREASPVKEG